MNRLSSVNFSLGPARAALSSLISDLREKRLWPVAAILLIAIIAVPIVLSKSSSPAPAPPVTLPATGGGGSASALPAVSVATAAAPAKLNAKPRDPFHPQGGAKPKTTTTVSAHTATTVTSTGAKVATSATRVGRNASAPGASAQPAPSTVHVTTPQPAVPAKPVTQPKPVSGLAPNDAYRVSLSITTTQGGLNAIDPLVRLTPLPSKSNPLLIELGVLQGGNRVLFLLQRNAVVSGPGSCTPGGVDCEVLAVSPGQLETLSENGPSGVVQIGQFAVTAIAVEHHSTAAVAMGVRTAVDRIGEKLLAASTAPVLKLFPFEPKVGAIVDQRNLSQGGN